MNCLLGYNVTFLLFCFHICLRYNFIFQVWLNCLSITQLSPTLKCFVFFVEIICKFIIKFELATKRNKLVLIFWIIFSKIHIKLKFLNKNIEQGNIIFNKYIFLVCSIAINTHNRKPIIYCIFHLMSLLHFYWFSFLYHQHS